MTIMALILTCSIYGGQGSDLGLGIIIGEPTGICVKYFTSPTGAVAGAAAWSLSGDEKALHIYGDYLFHMSELATWEGGRSPFYAGVGARAIFREGSSMFKSNPPMAFSDYWAGRVCTACIPFAIVSVGAMLAGGTGSPSFRVHLMASVALVLGTWVIFRFKRPHHPAAHVLMTLSNLALLYSTLSGFPGPVDILRIGNCL